MTLCKCGCGKEVAEGKQFLQGHYSTWMKKQRENMVGQNQSMPSTPIIEAQTPPAPILLTPQKEPISEKELELLKAMKAIKQQQPSWLKRLFTKKSKPIPVKVPIEEILMNLPSWSIKEKPPLFMSKQKKQRLIQFAGFSKKRAPVFCWVLYNGIYISVGDVAGEERLYEPPNAIHGNVFPYDLDKKRPLLDNAINDDNAHESLRMGQVKNMAYALARIKSMQGLFDSVNTLYLLVGISILLNVINAILLYSYTKDVPGMVNNVNAVIIKVTEYMATHG